MMVPSSSLPHVLQRPAHPLQPRRPTPRFWCLMPKGERVFEYVVSRGATFRGASYLVLVYYIHLEFYLCDTLLLMHSCVYFHAYYYIYVIVLST